MTCDLIYGYSGLYRLPFEHLDHLGTSMYCLTTDLKRTLIAIPLSPHFFNDLYIIAKHPQYQKIILVVPAMDCIWISDIYNFYQEVACILRKDLQIVCPQSNCRYCPSTSDDFRTKLVHGPHVDITMMHDRSQTLAAVIDFIDIHNETGRLVHDIILSTNWMKIYFALYMNEGKLQWLIENPHYYDEIHMPFTNITYGGLGYMDIRNKSGYQKLLQKVRVNTFRTEEEAAYCTASSIPFGRVIYRDLV